MSNQEQHFDCLVSVLGKFILCFFLFCNPKEFLVSYELITYILVGEPIYIET